MNWWEWVVFVTGVAAVALTVKQHLLNWPNGIANSAALLVVAVQAKLYSDGGLQVFYIVLGFYGWWHWLYGNPTKRNALPVTRTPVVEAVLLAIASVITYCGLAVLLAQYLLTRKYLANWAVWIFLSNVPYVALYLYKDLPLLVALQPIYIALSIWGWVDWRRSMALARAQAVIA